MNTKRNYLLLTPGPLSTSETVREAMLQDWCTWDKDYNEGIVTPIRKGLLAIAGLDEDEYTDVLLQGSGTYCVEATIGAAVKPTDKLLILANGAYGKRMAQIAEYYHIDHVLVSLHETELVTGEVARKALEANPDITHLSMVHSETTTGLLNPIEEVAEVLKGRNITFIVDAMSSFGGVPIDMKRSKKIVWKVRYAMYKQRLWTNSQTTGESWNRSCPKETTDITIIPIIINPKRIERAFRLSFTKTINPKTTRIISVTTLSIFAKSQGEYSETSMIFTKKSSFISRNTTMAILATNNIMRKGIKFLNNSQRCFPFNVARSDFIAISSSGVVSVDVKRSMEISSSDTCSMCCLR
jgi:hypothetical protein